MDGPPRLDGRPRRRRDPLRKAECRLPRSGAGPSPPRPHRGLRRSPRRLRGLRVAGQDARRQASGDPGLPLLHAGDARPPDLLLLGKIREIFRRKRSTAREPKVDLIVLDAPATGHALSLVALPRTLLATVPAGPVRKLAEWLDALLSQTRKTPRSSSCPSPRTSRRRDRGIDRGRAREGGPLDRARRPQPGRKRRKRRNSAQEGHDHSAGRDSGDRS